MARNSTSPAGFARKLNRRPVVRWLFWLGVFGLVVLLGGLFNNLRGGFYHLPVADVVNVGVDWLIINLAVVFDGIKFVIARVLNGLEGFVLWLPWWAALTLITLVAWRLAGVRVAIFTVAAMYFIGMLGLWKLCMSTLALIATGSTDLGNVGDSDRDTLGAQQPR